MEKAKYDLAQAILDDTILRDSTPEIAEKFLKLMTSDAMNKILPHTAEKADYEEFLEGFNALRQDIIGNREEYTEEDNLRCYRTLISAMAKHKPGDLEALNSRLAPSMHIIQNWLQETDVNTQMTHRRIELISAMIVDIREDPPQIEDDQALNQRIEEGEKKLKELNLQIKQLVDERSEIYYLQQLSQVSAATRWLGENTGNSCPEV